MADELLQVDVTLPQQAYTIQIGTGNLDQVSAVFSRQAEARQAILITDRNVRPLHADPLARSLEEAGIASSMLVIEPGESSKSIDVAGQLWADVLATGADRTSIVVAVGGGVVGDLAGFIAATYARGIRLLQVPTTLLAQVDSSVGGKVGINLPTAKNMVGAFWQPCAVICDTQTLNSLPDREFSAGLAEVVKYGVILDEEFFVELEEHAEAIWNRDAALLRRVVARCCELKAGVVGEDERETTGRRAVLNYGHTFCHAIESLTGYGQFLHGEAVSLGMLCASRLAASMGRIDDALTERQRQLLTRFHLPVEMPSLDPGQMVELMQHDKKARHGQLRFVLPSRLGEVELVDGVDLDLVRQSCR